MTKLTIITEKDGREPIVMENAKGILAVVRMSDGVQKCLIGELNTMDLAMMIKAIVSGRGPENEKLRKAWMVSAALPDPDDEDIRYVTPRETGLNNPFDELTKE